MQSDINDKILSFEDTISNKKFTIKQFMILSFQKKKKNKQRERERKEISELSTRVKHKKKKEIITINITQKRREESLLTRNLQ